MSHDPRIQRAQSAIAKLLIDLEREIGREVVEVETRRQEVTSFVDEKPRFFKHVVISVKPDEINSWV